MWQIVEVNAGDRCLQICNIHLPSGRQLGPAGAASKRTTELQEAIESCLVKLDIVAGDFNEQPGGPVSRCMESHDYADSAMLSGRDGVPTNIGQGRGDYIWVKRSMSTRLLEYDVATRECLAREDAGEQYLSDHLPLWIALENR